MSERGCACAPSGEPSPHPHNTQDSSTTPLPSTVYRSAADAIVTIKDHSAKSVRRRRQRLCRFFMLRGQLVLPVPADALTLGQRRNERVRVRGQWYGGREHDRAWRPDEWSRRGGEESMQLSEFPRCAPVLPGPPLRASLFFAVSARKQNRPFTHCTYTKMATWRNEASCATPVNISDKAAGSAQIGIYCLSKFRCKEPQWHTCKNFYWDITGI